MPEFSEQFAGSYSHSVQVDGITDWLTEQALREPELTDLFDGCCRRLYSAGIPIGRAMLGYTTLHPLYQSKTLHWKLGETVTSVPHAHSEEPSPDWLKSPLYFMVHNRLNFMRRHLSGPDALLDFEFLEDLKKDGYTDYLAYTITFQENFIHLNSVNASGVIGSWATKRPGGFSDADIRALNRIQNQLAVAAKVRIKDEIADNVMTTYLGPGAGKKVLSGQIKRGDGDTISAIVWYSDLRKSTMLAEKLGAQQFIQLLNRYFECTADSILSNNGEVLRFVGDAVLAIFPMPTKSRSRRPGRNALAAVRAAISSMHRLRAEGLPVQFGVGLHYGEVVYGNIGVASRLEFSVVGTTANEVARIEDLTKKIKVPVLISQSLAERLDCELQSKGTHNVKGVGKGVEVYTLPEFM